MKSFKDLLIFLPTFGILIFVVLFVYAASLYPGGSQADINSVGFDWFNNFWCNLMLENALNGQENLARPTAFIAIIILCSSVALNYYYFASIFEKNRAWKLILKISGTISMVSAVFIFTKYHDVMTTLLSVFGTFGIIAIMRRLHKNNMTFLKISGIVCIILVVMNNLFYYIENLIEYLPVIQKMTFIVILTWVIGLNLKMRNKKLL
ncbi:hypothetical protein [Pontimicrobium aquaticum]|uniref:DUF998 domain-containing protein n=1 Tax=Pontimicrobium aquaticum TaxID=2565367 RepID=A0A4V5LQ42_9FLAO|nr:hypothetical protein [Pontimicrobium aquaticum]TJY33929.1 hypothetical protein E5167_11435 [Pontimicrobium aquaticum]